MAAQIGLGQFCGCIAVGGVLGLLIAVFIAAGLSEFFDAPLIKNF